MKTRYLRSMMPWLLLAALPLAAGGCKSHEETSSNPAPGETTPAEAKASLSDVKVGHELGADGKIAADQKGTKFAPGEPVIVAFQIGKAPAGTVVHVDWVGPNDQPLGGEDKTVAAGDSAMSFTSKDTSGWGKGDYRADLSVGGQKVDTERFSVTEPGKGDNAATKPKHAISDLTVGHQLAADGSIAPKEKGKDFQPGQTVYIAFKAGDAPAGTVIHVAWVGPNGQDLGGEDKPVAAGQTYTNFAATKTSGWGLGDYKADLSTGGEKVDTAHFSIVNAKKADKPAT
jgi:hypothetical protein